MENSSNPSTGQPRKERLPISTVLPRAWIGFSQAPWQCVGLAGLILLSFSGLGIIAHDLQLSSTPILIKLGNLLLLLSLVVPLFPLLALLRLADDLLPGGQEEQAPRATQRQRFWVLRQAMGLIVVESLILMGGITSIEATGMVLATFSGALASVAVMIGWLTLSIWLITQLLALPLLIHHRHRMLRAMDHSRQIVQTNRLKVLALLGLLIGLNLLGLIGAFLGLLLSLPFSALVLMASCRTQTPWVRESRRNMLPT
ncbi:MAG: hypothetical protein AB8A46_02650 [Prochlorococcus sp.]|nr:hypothetical protein [Prochlorococcus sp.]MDP6193157.1 hypothetical protein [Prochlorococcaceae cyanobacterium ETNP18_MAG_1]